MIKNLIEIAKPVNYQQIFFVVENRLISIKFDRNNKLACFMAPFKCYISVTFTGKQANNDV